VYHRYDFETTILTYTYRLLVLQAPVALPRTRRTDLGTSVRHPESTGMRQPQIPEGRHQIVESARQSWIRKLIDLSRRNNLLYFRPLKTGTLDLSSAPPEKFRDLLTGETVAASRLAGCTTLKLATCPAGLPVILESSTHLTTTQGDDGVSTAHRPEHSRPFQPSQYSFTACFDDSGAHE